VTEKISSAKQAKVEQVAGIRSDIERAKSVVIISYKGLTVAQDTELRREFRKNNVQYQVLKNTLIKRAFNELGNTEFDEALNGTTSVAFSFEDEITAARVVVENAKKLAGKFEPKCAYVDGSFADLDTVQHLASLPSKEVLISKVMGSLNAPITGFVGVLSATLRSLVYAVKAVHDQKAGA